MKKILLASIIVLFIGGCSSIKQSVKVGFWNVENLFDLENDPLKNDDEFSLNGRKMITQEILDMKLDHMVEVLMDLNVDILGLCEVENRKVLEMLNENTRLKFTRYISELAASKPKDEPVPDFFVENELRGYLNAKFLINPPLQPVS